MDRHPVTGFDTQGQQSVTHQIHVIGIVGPGDAAPNAEAFGAHGHPVRGGHGASPDSPHQGPRVREGFDNRGHVVSFAAPVRSSPR